MKTPVISVIVVTYNHERFIAEALDGVLSQRTAVPIEVIVSEDASTDRTLEIVKGYVSLYPEKLRLLTSARNLNTNAVTVRAIEAARGQYVAIMDGDDLWNVPDKLDRQFKHLETHPEYSACFHDVSVVDCDGRSLEPRFVRDEVASDTGLAEILVGNYAPGSAAMFRREALSEVPPWVNEAPYGDWGLLIAAARHGRLTYLREVLGAYRLHRGGVWSSLDQAQKAAGIVAFYDYLEPQIWPEWRTTLRHVRAGWRANQINVLDRLERLGDVEEAIAEGARRGDIAQLLSDPPQTTVEPVAETTLKLLVTDPPVDATGDHQDPDADFGFIDDVDRSMDGRRLTVTGWGALTRDDPQPVLLIETAQSIQHAAAVRLSRPDVASIVDPALDRSGFWLRIVIHSSSADSISLLVIDRDGNRTLIGAIAPPQPAN